MTCIEYPKGDISGPCLCGSWPGGNCFKCEVIPMKKHDLIPTFTKGPWKLGYIDPVGTDGDGLQISIDGINHGAIATAIWKMDRETKSPEQEATAKLIAKAPEMFDILAAIWRMGDIDNHAISAIIEEFTTNTPVKEEKQTQEIKQKELSVNEILQAILNKKQLQVINPVDETWFECSNETAFSILSDGRQAFLRIKPDTIKIGEYDVPIPTKISDMAVGQKYFVADIFSDYKYSEYVYSGSFIDTLNFSHGMAHLTQEAAIEHAKALISFTNYNNLKI